MNDKIKTLLASDVAACDEAWQRYAAGESGELSGLFDAMRYSLEAGGKRIRPILVLESCRMLGGNVEAAVPYAVACELVHTASLIHDDLPAIDNDALRRGRPTNHTVFGEATALLAADALFLDAFALVAENTALPAERNAAAVGVLSRAVGSRGMVGGEYIDVECEGKSVPYSTLCRMHSLKTGALIRGACMLGAIAAGVMPGDARMDAVIRYAECIGLAFQITDDVLDRTGTAEALGKLPGADEAAGKTTFLTFMSVDEAMARAAELTKEAVAAISPLCGSEVLAAVAESLAKRSF